jgi:hypothetical protein
MFVRQPRAAPATRSGPGLLSFGLSGHRGTAAAAVCSTLPGPVSRPFGPQDNELFRYPRLRPASRKRKGPLTFPAHGCLRTSAERAKVELRRYGNLEKGPSYTLATYTYALAGYRLSTGELSLSSRELSLYGDIKSLERWRGIL